MKNDATNSDPLWGLVSKGVNGGAYVFGLVGRGSW